MNSSSPFSLNLKANFRETIQFVMCRLSRFESESTFETIRHFGLGGGVEF